MGKTEREWARRRYTGHTDSHRKRENGRVRKKVSNKRNIFGTYRYINDKLLWKKFYVFKCSNKQEKNDTKIN